MTVDELTKNASNKGFERGSLATINAVLAWLQRTGYEPVARVLLNEWDAGNITQSAVTHHPAMIDGQPLEPLTPVVSDVAPPPFTPTDLGPIAPKLITRATATQFGFTGNCCSTCGGYQMVRNGTCEKCQDCGSTTGCS